MNPIKIIRTFSYHFRNLVQQSSYSQEYLEKLQFSKLKETVIYAWNNIPFYRYYWESAGFSPDMLIGLEDIKKIPFIDKNIIREHFEEIKPTNYKGKITKVTSGGTTGLPMEFYLDQNIARAKEIAYQIWGNMHYFGYKMFVHKIAVFRGFHIHKHLLDKKIYWQRFSRERGLTFSSFHLTTENYQIYINKLREFQPNYIKAYPSSIYLLCKLMKENNDTKIDGLKGIICSSENVYDWQRNMVKEVLGVEIYSMYGHSEKSVQAFQNTEGEMEFMPLYGYTEFLDEFNREATLDGQLAEIICTSFDNKYFPFIRYRTNDFVEVSKNSTRCRKIAKRIVGRAQEFVYDNQDNKILFTNSDEPFWGIEGIEAYQYVQNRKGELIIRIQTNEKYNIESDNIICNKARDYFLNFAFKIEKVEKIEKTLAGKFRYLIQNIKGETQNTEKTKIQYIVAKLGLGADKDGVEDGGERIISTPEFRHQIQEKPLCAGIIMTKEPTVDDRYRYSFSPSMKWTKEIMAVNTVVCNHAVNAHKNNYIPFVIGGDHSLGIGSVMASLNTYDNLGVIWLDAHADMNLPETSPSHNIHGMTLSPLMGLGPDILRDGLERKLKPENIILLGTRSIDPGEMDIIKKYHINLFTTEDIQKKGVAHVYDEISNIIKRNNIHNIHLSIDIDVVDPHLAPGTGVPEENGLSTIEFHEIISTLLSSRLTRAVDFVEYNPKFDIDNKTLNICLNTIRLIFDNIA